MRPRAMGCSTDSISRLAPRVYPDGRLDRWLRAGHRYQENDREADHRTLLRSGWGEATLLGAIIFRDLTMAQLSLDLPRVWIFHSALSKTTTTMTHALFVGRDEADTANPRGVYGEEAVPTPIS